MTLDIKAGRRVVGVTRPEKQLFPCGITKAGVARYYADIAPAMLPHVRGRPLSMERYPDGIGGELFFQKNVSKYFPDWIAVATMRKRGGVTRHPMANDAATLVYLAGQASIAQHVTLSRADEPDRPDLVVVDLDPSGEDFSLVRRTALEVRDAFLAAGLVPFVKTTGSKGLHVAAPIRRTATFDDTFAFAREVATTLVERHPADLTFEFSKAKRSGRIYMDIGRNGYGATYVAPYSLRARPGAPVSMPVTWDEVASPSLRPDAYTIADAVERVERLGDLWATMRKSARSLPSSRDSGR